MQFIHRYLTEDGLSHGRSNRAHHLEGLCETPHNSAQRNSAPEYLTDDSQLVANIRTRQLRSADTQTCIIARTRITLEDRAFSAVGPIIWNSLPADVRKSDMSFFNLDGRLKHSSLCSDAKAPCELFNGVIEIFLFTDLLTYLPW